MSPFTWSSGVRHGLGGLVPKMLLCTPPWNRISTIFFSNFDRFCSQKSVNNVCKLLQLPGGICPSDSYRGFAPVPHWGTSVSHTPRAKPPKRKFLAQPLFTPRFIYPTCQNELCSHSAASLYTAIKPHEVEHCDFCLPYVLRSVSPHLRFNHFASSQYS